MYVTFCKQDPDNTSRASDHITSWDAIRTDSGPGLCLNFLSVTVLSQVRDEVSIGTTGKITCTGLYKMLVKKG